MDSGTEPRDRGINVAWNTTGSLGGATPAGSWNTSTYPYNWNTHPCPEGYRLPTNTEFQNLINSGTLSDAGNEGDYWSSVAYSSDNAYGLGFYSSFLNVYNLGKQTGFSVRCVR